MQSESQLSLPAIRTSFRQARQTPRARHRDIAQALGLSEGELVAAHAGAFDLAESPLNAFRLRGAWPDIVAALPALGEVMALTRNDHCVHEKVGVYKNISVEGPPAHQIGLVLGDIDLRVFYGCWRHGFAVEERLSDGATQRSLQFFDAQGQAVHKVFLRPASTVEAYDDLVARFLSDEREGGIVVQAESLAPVEIPDEQVDLAAFRHAWAAMQDTHEFFGLLRKFKLTRTQALRLASRDYAIPVAPSSAHEVLLRAAQESVPIMVFVGNPGIIQIHSGPVKRIEVMGPWVNVLDEGFNLHLREDHIAHAWIVKKPTADGVVHSLELFDAEGETIAMLFGERKPGQPELSEWRAVLAFVARDPESGIEWV